MDNKSSSRFWFFWISVFLNGLILLVTGIYHVDGALRIALICATVIWFVLGMLLVIGEFANPNKIKKHPILITDAKVVSKVSGLGVTATYFYVSFEFSDGTRENFSVFVNQYNSVVEGETGTLTYKKYKHHLKFIDFKLVK